VDDIHNICFFYPQKNRILAILNPIYTLFFHEKNLKKADFHFFDATE